MSKNSLRYKVSSAIPGEKPGRVESIIKMMENSMTVNVAYHANDPNVGLALTRDNEYFKMYVGDTGLFITLAFKDKDFTDNVIYNKLLNDKLSTNLGHVYENVFILHLL